VVIGLIQTCDMTYSKKRSDSCLQLRIAREMCDVVWWCVMLCDVVWCCVIIWLFHTSDMTHLSVWHDSMRSTRALPEGCVMMCDVVWCCVMLCDVVLWYVMMCDDLMFIPVTWFLSIYSGASLYVGLFCKKSPKNIGLFCLSHTRLIRMCDTTPCKAPPCC